MSHDPVEGCCHLTPGFEGKEFHTEECVFHSLTLGMALAPLGYALILR